VYTFQSSIHRVSEAGGPPQVLASGLAMPGGIATDGTHVCWTEDSSLSCVPVTGGVAPKVVSSALAGASALVLLGGTAYVVENPLSASGSLVGVSLADGSTTPLESNAVFPAVPVTDGTSLYFLMAALAPCNASDRSDGCIDNQVMRFTPGDAAPTQFSTVRGGVHAYAVGGGEMYVSLEDYSAGGTIEGVMERVPLSGASPTSLATTASYYPWLAVSSASVDWSSSDGVGWSTPLPGGGATQMASPGVMQLAGDLQGGTFAIVIGPEGDAALVAVGK
jgi:hypothetical protein